MEFDVRGDIIMGNGTPFERDEWPIFHAAIAHNRGHDRLCVSCASSSTQEPVMSDDFHVATDASPSDGQDDCRGFPPIAAVFRARDSTETPVTSRTWLRHRFILGEKR